MTSILGLEEGYLKMRHGINTAREINHQPKLWKETYDYIYANRKIIKEFLNKALIDENVRIVFTGAGSSAFVGECVTPYLDRVIKQRVETIATTDIVSNPRNYLHKDIPTVMISCARSGNSPESVAAVKLAEKHVDNLYQIFLTCNPEGELAQKHKDDDRSLLLLMPEGSNDKGFAMTSSFTTMVLTTLLIFNINDLATCENNLNTILRNGKDILEKDISEINRISKESFNRIVYLGSSGLKGLARESALKVLELTRGKISSSYDSPLGFRHGPKSIIDDNTLIVVFVSKDLYTRKYDIDLLKELKLDGGGKKVIAITSNRDEAIENMVDFTVPISNGDSYIDDAFLILNYILFAQTLALFKSLELNISPDNPSPDGKVNRVVKGVTIYEY